MNKKYTTQVLENYRKILVAEFKRQLNKKGSRLEASITSRKLPNRDGFGIYMNDYGVNVNDGRKRGRFPNIDNIKDWIIRKGIKPRTFEDTKPSSLNALAYLIGRSIARKGIKPTRFIDLVSDRFEPEITINIANAYARDLNEELDKNIKNASSKN